MNKGETSHVEEEEENRRENPHQRKKKIKGLRKENLDNGEVKGRNNLTKGSRKHNQRGE